MLLVLSHLDRGEIPCLFLDVREVCIREVSLGALYFGELIAGVLTGPMLYKVKKLTSLSVM